MADVTITGLPNASALTGTERVPMDQNGTTVDAAASAIAGLATKVTVGLGNADNTADLDKPVSTATAAALAGKVDVGAPSPALVAVRNNSGAALTVGTPVYVTGSSGTRPTVAAADASTEATAAQTLGLMNASANNNADGVVITQGILSGVNTATLTEGQIVWLSETTGQLTTTRPTQPAHGVFMGLCVKQGSGTSGILYVAVINGQELAELHDVLLNGATTGQVLALAADGLWKNKTLAAADVGAAASVHTQTASTISDSTAAGRALLTAADATAQRTALGLGTLATQSGTFSGTSSGTNTGDQTISLTGDVTGSGTGSFAATLANTTVTGGAYGSASQVGTFTVDGKGRLTAAANTAISVEATAISDSTATGRAVVTAANAAAARSAIGAGTSSVAISSTPAAALGATAAAGSNGQAADSGHVHQRDSDFIIVPVGDETTAVTTGANKVRFRMPYGATLLSVRASVNTAPTGSSLIVDINEAGTSVLGAKLSIDAGATTSLTSVLPATIADSSLAGNAEIAIDIDQIGSTVAGAGLKVTLEVRRS